MCYSKCDDRPLALRDWALCFLVSSRDSKPISVCMYIEFSGSSKNNTKYDDDYDDDYEDDDIPISTGMPFWPQSSLLSASPSSLSRHRHRPVIVVIKNIRFDHKSVGRRTGVSLSDKLSLSSPRNHVRIKTCMANPPQISSTSLSPLVSIACTIVNVWSF